MVPPSSLASPIDQLHLCRLHYLSVCFSLRLSSCLSCLGAKRVSLQLDSLRCWLVDLQPPPPHSQSTFRRAAAAGGNEGGRERVTPFFTVALRLVQHPQFRDVNASEGSDHTQPQVIGRAGRRLTAGSPCQGTRQTLRHSGDEIWGAFAMHGRHRR